jgi:hypothetical protein
MRQRNLFNMNQDSEVYQGILGAFRALERKDNVVDFRERQIPTRRNTRGRRFVEVPAHLSVRFRIYEPDDQGKSLLMAVIDDLYAFAGEDEGRNQYDNPVLWGRVMRNANRGVSLFFFNDPPAREAVAEVKKDLVARGLVRPEQVFTEDELAAMAGRGEYAEKLEAPEL